MMVAVVKSSLVVCIYLSNIINPLQCAAELHGQWSYSNLQEAALIEYLQPATFTNALNQNTLLAVQQKPQLAKRQTIDDTLSPEDRAYCSAQLIDASCSTGLVQGTIDADLSCGRNLGIEEAKIRANGCARNEHGQYCSSALSLFNADGMALTYIDGNCSGLADFCPIACRSLLEDFRSRLGCCINTYINNSRSLSASVDYRVWNLCNVPIPAADCGNSPVTVNPPDDVQECTDEESFNRRYTQNLCLPQRGQAYVDAIVLNSRCRQSLLFSSAEYVTRLCSMDPSGRVCGITYAPFDSVDLDQLNSDCATSNVSCTSNCRDGISNATELRGCCVNWANFSTFPVPVALSYDVWKSCGIETPGFCESPLNLKGTAVSITKKNYLIFLIIAAGLICHYM